MNNMEERVIRLESRVESGFQMIENKVDQNTELTKEMLDFLKAESLAKNTSLQWRDRIIVGLVVFILLITGIKLTPDILSLFASL